MISRWQEERLRHMLNVRRGVHLTGARQCGKTTLAGMVSSGKSFSFDKKSLRDSARNDPYGFTARPAGGTMVVDEIQKVPELLESIKERVDHDNSCGQYLLTGSSNLRFLKTIRDSLAGRFGTIRLRTLALGEIVGGRGDFLSDAMEGRFHEPQFELDKRDVIHAAFCGGYPESREYEPADRLLWYGDYLADLLVKDIKDVTEIRKVDALRKVAQWLLAHSSKFFELQELGGKAQLSHVTLTSYLSALKALYLFDEVPAWSGSDYAKIGKREKWFASDPGLVANLLDWDENETYYDGDKSGKIVETWAYHEISALADLTPGLEVSQYRDSDRREVDFIVENRKGDILGIEVKAGTVSSGDFTHLKWFASNLAPHGFVGIVLYTGKDILPFGKNLFAIPMACLAH